MVLVFLLLQLQGVLVVIDEARVVSWLPWVHFDTNKLLVVWCGHSAHGSGILVNSSGRIIRLVSGWGGVMDCMNGDGHARGNSEQPDFPGLCQACTVPGVQRAQ